MTNSTGISADPERQLMAGTFTDRRGPALLCLNADQEILVLSQQAARLLQLPPTSTPRSLADLPAPLPAVVHQLLRDAAQTLGQTFELPTSAGTLTLRVKLLPWQPRDGLSGAVLLLEDLNIVQRFDQDLQRLNRLASLGTLSAGMAHEIKNALVPVRTFIELLLEKHPDAELGQIVRREMDRVDGIVSRMLGFAGPSRPILSKMSVEKVLQHSLRLVHSQLSEKGIACQPTFGAVPDLVKADAAQLQQALVNLLLNALEAMQPGGTLTVTTERTRNELGATLVDPALESHWVRITIKDTGPGISPQDLARLFEPFFTTKPNGTGLGLAITQQIVHEHRGKISVESTPGSGTVFRIALPALNEEPQPH